MALVRRHWDRLGNGGLDFTELGFGAAPLGNLYRAITDADGRGDPRDGLGGGRALLRHRAALWARPVGDAAEPLPARQARATTTCCRPRSAGCCARFRTGRRDGIGKWFEVPSRAEVYDYGYDAVFRSLEFSLERLGRGPGRYPLCP